MQGVVIAGLCPVPRDALVREVLQVWNVLELCCLDVVSHGFAYQSAEAFHLLRTVGRNFDACLYAVHIALPYVVLRPCLVLERVIRDDDVGKRCIVRVGWRHFDTSRVDATGEA